jgi:hypothetical protein
VQAASGIADSGDPEQDLTDLLREMGEVAQATGAGALFLIDEMHNLDASALSAICIAFQAVSRNGLPVAMVAAGLPDLKVRLMSAKPYAGGERDRQGLAGPQLLRHAPADGHRHRAALPRRDGGGRQRPLPLSGHRQPLRAKDQRGASVHREALIHKGLIWSPRRGQLDFTVPLFAEYLTENHPLEGFEEGLSSGQVD